MKTKMKDWITIECDLSEHDKEVSDYVLDQLEDRLSDTYEITELLDGIEIEKDYDKQKLRITSILIEFIQRIIEEKEQDIEYERQHGERE